MHEIKLYDAIGYGGITAAELTAAIPADATEVTIRINSPGGAVSDGLAMYNYLKDHPAKITTVVDGYAASAASIVMLAGDVRVAHKSSIIMIHDPWSMAVGDSNDLRHTADVLDEHAEALVDIYEAATGIGRDELRAMMDAETWMRGEAALDYGFATMVIDAGQETKKQAAASVQFAHMFAALQGGKELMSKEKTRKEIAAELEQAKATIDEVKIEAAETVAEVEAKAEQEKAEVLAQLDAVKADIEAIRTERDEAKAALELVNAEIETAKAELVEVSAQVETANAEAEAAKAALVNPAVADAVLADANPEAIAQVDAEADAAEEAARVKADIEENAEPKNELEQWEAMDQGADRSAFWAANKRAIFRQMEAREKQEVK